MRRLLLLIAAGLALTACMTDPSAEQTAQVVGGTLDVELAAARASATFEADRRMITQSAAEGRATQIARQRGQIVGTLVELGYPAPDLSLITPATPNPDAAQPLFTPTVDVRDAPAGGITRLPPTIDPNITPTPTAAPVTAAPTLDPNGPRLEGIVTAAGVGDDDCAAGTTSEFSPTSTEIYVVATGFNIAAGTTIQSNWLRGDAPLTSFEFAPGSAVNGACIWFFANQSDFAFETGTYRIDLLIGGALAGSVTFEVR